MDTKFSIEMINTHLAFDLTMEDFNHPKPERIQLVCRAFVMYVFDIPESSLLHLPLDAISDTDEPEFMQRSAPLIMVFTALNQFIHDMSIDYHFTMEDLITPTSQKFRRLASFLADYLKFYTAMLPHWESTCAVYDDKRAELAELQQAVQEAEKKKEAATIAMEGRKRRENELMTILGKKQAEFATRFAASKQFEERANENQEIVEQEKFTQDELMYEKDSLQMQLDQLSLQIMPEHIITDRERLREEVVHVREQCEAQRKKCQETKESINMTATVRTLIDKAEIHTEELLAKKAQLDKLLMEKMDREQRARDAQRRLQDVIDQKNAAQAEQQKKSEDAEVNYLMHQERMKELANRKHQLEQELIQLKQVNSCDPAEERRLRQDIANMRSLKDETLSNLKHYMDQNTQSYKTLIKTLEDEKLTFIEDARHYEGIVKNLQATAIETSNDLNDTANQTIPV